MGLERIRVRCMDGAYTLQNQLRRRMSMPNPTHPGTSQCCFVECWVDMCFTQQTSYLMQRSSFITVWRELLIVSWATAKSAKAPSVNLFSSILRTFTLSTLSNIVGSTEMCR